MSQTYRRGGPDWLRLYFVIDQTGGPYHCDICREAVDWLEQDRHAEFHGRQAGYQTKKRDMTGPVHTRWLYRQMFDPPNRRGFTLIEIVIAVLLIGILATIAVPKFQAHKRQAHVAAAISQLRHLQQAQEHHYLEADSYAATVGALPDLQVASKIPIVIVAGTQMGWSATARYRETTVVCAIFYGTAPIPPPATPADDGEPVCTW